MSTINVNTDNLTLQAVLNLLNNVPKKLEKEVAEAVYNVVQPIIANTLIEYQELFKFFTAVEEFKNEVGLDPVADDQRAELTAQKYVAEDDAEQAQSEQASATQTEATASTESEAQTEKANDQQVQAQDDQINNDASPAEAQTSQDQEQAQNDPVQNNDTENKGTQAQDQKEQTKLTDEVKAKLAELPKELIEQYLAQLKDNSADPEQKKTA